MQVEETTDEQQTNGATELSVRDQLLAAVKEAGGTDAVETTAEEEEAAAAEAGAKTEPEKPKEGAAPAEPADPDEPKVAAILRAREKAWKERQAAESYAEQKRREAEEEAQRILTEAKTKAEREAQDLLEAQRRKFSESPTETIRALAPDGDTQKIVDAVIRDGTPEGRAIRELQKQVDEAKAGTKEAVELKKQLADMKAEIEREKVEARIAQVRAEFFSQNATKDKAPYAHARWDENEFFDKANELCKDWQTKGLVLEQDFTRDDLVDWLERDSKKRYSAFVSPPQQVSGGAPGREQGNAPKVSANGSRTLSAATGSERRTTPKPLSEMTKEEQREALIAEVAAVRRTLKDNAP